LLIWDAVSGERLGNIALSHADGIGHVSYWLAAAARGRGAATRALRPFSGCDFAGRLVDWAALRCTRLRFLSRMSQAASHLSNASR
jgi:hypothetical protein